jgi:hypothetical protein
MPFRQAQGPESTDGKPTLRRRAEKKTKQSSTKRGAVAGTNRSEHDDSPGVTALVASMTHPLKLALEAVRRTVLAADPAITEGIKWNSPSFYCHGWFATISSRKPTQLDIVLHCGAKVRGDCGVRDAINDTDHLLTWPSKDRALLSIKSDADFRTKRQPFQRIVQQWADYQKEMTKHE